MYSVDSSLTLLVDNGYDDPGELSKLEFDTSDSIWGVLQYVLVVSLASS